MPRQPFNNITLLTNIRSALLEEGLETADNFYVQLLPDDVHEGTVVALTGGPLLRTSLIRNVRGTIQVRTKSNEAGLSKITSIAGYLHDQWELGCPPGRIFLDGEPGPAFRDNNGLTTYFLNFVFTTV